MRRSLAVFLGLLALNSTACCSRAAGNALVEVTAMTITAMGAAALEAAAEAEQAEHDAREAERRARDITTDSDTRGTDRSDLQAEVRVNARRVENPGKAAPRQRPAISIGHCMVCK